MLKITFMGAGSTVFSRHVLGDTLMTPALCDTEIALYDIDAQRLEDSFRVISFMNESANQGRASIKSYLGPEQRKDALRNADFVINAIQVGGYEPCTVIDFEIPKKYGLRQTIADTLAAEGGSPDVLDEDWRKAVLASAREHVLMHTALSDRDRQVYRAYAMEGEDICEVAKKFGLSRNLVSQIKTRIEKRIIAAGREMIAKEGL